MIRLCLLLLFLAATSGYAASHCPCENGGDCVYGSSGFKYCKCQKGYGGRHCGELLECSNYLPCQNGGRCVNSHGRNQCLCLNGWTGPDCSINIDDCALNPCANGGKCHDSIGSFSCECEKGWTGLLCQLRDGCASNPCHASATCYANPSNGSAICACPKGYKGEDCSIDINECFENGSPCEHGGVCVNTEGSFRCDCAVGFSGSRCEININECASNPCLNEATCLDEIGGYRCICMPGYTGTQCETDIDECVDKPCLNNGVCTNLINGYRCLCPNGYNGTRCEINENECDPNPCVNGFCIDGIAQYKCKCNPGWEGHNCEININECLNHSCVNGYCIDGINSYSCVCQAGFTGPHCEININDCAPDSCYHGGICHDLVNGFKCECPLGTSGIRCEYNTNECFSNPCRNGVCHDKINGYECECKPGFTGLNCEIDIDECASNPCANGGKCHDLPNGFRCTCPKGYYDSRCLSDVNECDPNPCMNGGHCEDDVNKFICHCLSGFSGTRCELEVDACASSPCQHNGQCLNYMGNYKCVCPPEFTGKSCEINISDCNASIFGDCLLGYTVNPWINCSQSTFCWKAFSDGVCNEVCNTKECLFDGMDCLHKQRNAGPNNQYIVDKNDQRNQDIRLNGKRRQCDPEFDSYCQRNYQNGYCDQGCNNEQCGWDGLDCLEQNQRNNIKQFNYAELPYVARGSLLITLDVPVNRLSVAENAGHKSSATRPDERPIFAILRALSQIVGTTLRVKQNYNDGSFLLKPIRGDNGENMTEIEVIADNRLCEYDCFDSTTQIANYLAAFQARTNELSHQFGQSSKFALKSIRATEEAESLVASKYPKGSGEPTSVTTWITTCVIVIFIGLLLGVLISNKERRVSTGITWFPSNFKLKADDNRSISTYQAAGGDYLRKPLNKLRGNLNKMDRHADGQEMSKAWLQHETIHENKELPNPHVIYEEPKDPRSWSVQHLEAYGDGKNKNSTNIMLSLPMPNLKELLHPGLRQTQNAIMQTEASTEPMMANGLLSPPLMNTLNGDVDVVGPSGLTPLMVAAAFRGATPYCGVGDDLNKNSESTKLLDSNAIELMDTHNGPGSAGSQTSTNGNSMIDDLISQGANVDKKMENTGETSLHLAARFCRADAVKRLLEAKADCNAQDFKGRTPLHTAIAADACGAFEILIRNRATSLNAKSNDGNTPLILAVRNCADSMMSELLSAGADINATDNAQRTALHWAAMVSNLVGLKALIEHGANKDAQDEKEQTPLFLATREGAYDCVKTLLQAGANKDITDHMDVSPRKIAETKKHKDILALLDSEIKPAAQSSAPANGDPVPSSPKKPLNSSNNESTTNTAKRAKKQPAKQQTQTQTKFIPQQPLNATELLQQAQMQQTANVQTNYMTNAANTNTLKKAQQIVSNPNSALNQVPPPLPPPRPQLQPVPIKMSKNQVVNLPPIQTSNPQFEQQIYNQNLPSPFDHMMHTPLTPTSTTAANPMMSQINHPMPNTPNSITNLNSPQMANHALLSPNNTVLMSPPHHSNVMNQIMQPAPHPYYLGKPPPYESINHCTQQISNATYMTTVTQMQPVGGQWTAKQQEPNYYTIFNANTNNKTNHDASYLTPSPDSPGNWSATTSPASNGDWLELQTPAQQQTQQMHTDNGNLQAVNGANSESLQLVMVDQQQLSPAEQQMSHDQMQQQQQQQIVNDLNPPTYQASCNQQQQLDQQQLEQQQQQMVLANQQQTTNTASVNANTRQITSTQQAVFL